MQARHRELPFLAGIAGMLRWLEELANIVAGPLLTAGLAIALIDLLTDGRLLASQPELLYGWAVSQAVGVDAQLVGAWDKARQALRQRQYWALVGLLVLGVALAYVGWIAAEVFALQQSEGVTTTAALVSLGMNTSDWLIRRTLLSVVLVCLSGWTRYHPPAAPSAADERAKLERELELEPLRAQVRARKALGWRDVAGSLIQGAPALEGSPLPPAPPEPESEPPDDSPPTPPLPPRPARSAHPTSHSGRRVLKLPRPRPEQRVRAVLTVNPTASVRDIAVAAGVSFSTAAKYRRLWLAEQQRQNDDTQAAE